VQELLGLVLEAQHLDARALGHVGQGDALDAGAGVDGMAVRAGLRVADGGQHALLEDRRHRVLEPLGLLVDLVPGDAEHVGQEALDQAVATADLLGVALAALGERDRLVAGAGDVAVALEAADHLVHGGRRELHRARHVGAGQGQPRLLQPVQRLQVLLLRDGHIGHGAHRIPRRLPDAERPPVRPGR
jgi:hypothetical protein